MDKVIYLAGVISENHESHKWRRTIYRKLSDQFIIDDPCRSLLDREGLKKMDDEDEHSEQTWIDYIRSRPSGILLPKSYQAVNKADIIIINLRIYQEGHAGHIMELAWAYGLHKTVIAIGDESCVYGKHPMVNASVHAWVKNEEEAVALVKEYFYVSKK